MQDDGAPQVVRRLRERAGLRQADLAKAMRVTRSYICGVEHGRTRPSAAMLLRLAPALGVEEGYLLHIFYGAPAAAQEGGPREGRHGAR